MPQGSPPIIPDDGRSTRARRHAPLLVVHTGDMKGKTTAAFGLALRAWAAGLPVTVFQFVKSATWRTGEEAAFAALGRAFAATGEGAPVEWHVMGRGWSWSRGNATPEGEAAAREAARAGWAEVARRLAAGRDGMVVLDEFTYPLAWGWLDVAEVVATLRDRPGFQHVVVTGRRAPGALLDAADLAVEMTKITHPLDRGAKGQKGIEW